MAWLTKAEHPCAALQGRYPDWINGIDKCNAYEILRGLWKGHEVYDDDIRILMSVARSAARSEQSNAPI